MATRLYSIDPGQRENDIVEAVGSAIVTAHVELTVDLASTVVNDNGTTRSITKGEVLIALEYLMQYITRSNWTPA
jgi:hypothetical protein